MSGDLEARVVQAALDVVAWRYDDRGYDMVAACIRDPDHARGLGTTVMKEVEFAILGARAALAEIEKMIGGHLTVVLLAVRDEDNYE